MAPKGDVCRRAGEPPASRHVEVKGRAPGAKTVTITPNEVRQGVNQGDKFFLALVFVGEQDAIDGPNFIRACHGAKRRARPEEIRPGLSREPGRRPVDTLHGGVILTLSSGRRERQPNSASPSQMAPVGRTEDPW
jgi:hypothetical protein